MAERSKRKVAARKQSRYTIGTVEVVGKEGTSGVIRPWDSKGERVYFNVEDFAEEIDTADLERLRGLIVQFVKQPSETGLRARRITVLDREEAR